LHLLDDRDTGNHVTDFLRGCAEADQPSAAKRRVCFMARTARWTADAESLDSVVEGR
jgi:hypothetical protein